MPNLENRCNDVKDGESGNGELMKGTPSHITKKEGVRKSKVHIEHLHSITTRKTSLVDT